MCALPDASALLRTARAEYPDARLLYRPHPDVVAGLRPGQLASDAEVLADAIDPGCALEELWPRLDRVVTLTSTLGFEALLRGIPVTCYGWPFYAGWGLTDDRGLPGPEARRTATLTLDQLTHTALIDAPIYYDPVRRQPCDPETAMLRLAKAESTAPGLFLKTLSKAQGVLASTPFWR
jgi:capsular polysaccharide export protein